jgi:4-aminobutyrate aminotransferase-like enzyme
MTDEDLRAAADRYVLGALRRERRVVFARASGCRMWDTDGKEYLDAISGTNGPAMVGHAHPHVTAAVSEQLAELPSHFLIHDSEPLIRFAQRIDAISPVGPAKTFLCPGGGDAVEAAVKLAMRLTGRAEVISLHGAYHGMSLATMGLGGLPVLREWLPDGLRWPSFQQAPLPDRYRPSLGPDGWEPVARALEATLDAGTVHRPAAVIFELVQGPGGHVELAPGYAAEVERICRERGVLLIVDEVQTGLGRCGTTWACEQHGVTPDMVVIGKAFGGGFPFGGVIVRADLIDDEVEASPWHILTFMNQPLQAAAGNAVLDVVEEEGLTERAAKVGAHASGRFREMAERYEVIGDVRGPGLFIGVDLVEDRDGRQPATEACTAAWDHAMENGLITWFGGAGNVLKFKPPLNTGDAEIDAMLDLCEETIAFVEERVHGKSAGSPAAQGTAAP